MSEFMGRHGSLAIFANETNYVSLDTKIGVIVSSGYVDDIFSQLDFIVSEDEEFSTETLELIQTALSVLEPKALTASARLYTIPAGVQAEAKKALEWRKEEKRGGTPVGLNTARRLAKGGQIGIEKLRHIAKYFPRHEVDKKGKGWKPGEDNFPSNGRIAWALWGGDAGWRWSKAIVERDNKKAIKADAYLQSTGAELEAFEDATSLNADIAPDFLARIRLDGSGIDRIYKIDFDGRIYVWDDGVWDDLGHVEADIWLYDSELDSEEDPVEKTHVPIDPESAMIICARMQMSPYDNVSVSQLDEDEARIAAEAMDEEDWHFIDFAVTAAGEDPIGSTVTNPNVPSDGTPGYTAEDRSKNAAKQVRDATGRFAAQGTRVKVQGRPDGVITNIDAPRKMVTVKHDDGTTSTVAASDTRRVESLAEVRGQSETFDPDPNEIAPMDTSGILAEPRTPINQPKAQLPGTLPPLTRNDLASIIANYPAWVASQRNVIKPLGTDTGTGTPNTSAPAGTGTSTSPATTTPTSTTAGKPYFNPKTPYDTAPRSRLDTGETGKFLENLTGIKQKPGDYDAYKHPLLKDWLNKTVYKNGKPTNPNALWYQPITSAGEQKSETPAEEVAKSDSVSPSKPNVSDVQPLYLAIVAPEDPRAVLECVSIVPASSVSNQPMTYVRKDKKWVREPKFLDDLRSATPPPVVPLDSATLNDVLTQIDGLVASVTISYDQALMVLFGPHEFNMKNYEEVFFGELLPDSESLLAAGGADRNRGNAEKLRRYWTSGEGAAKIRWGTPGDWKRCVRYLSKYMGVRAKGYCQLRHKDATGVYTGSKLNPGNENSMEEVWGENIGAPTEITEKDMLMPIEIIISEQDDIYDSEWNPTAEIVKACEALATCSDEEFEALVAGARPPSAYNIDKNRKNAEKLRRYWTKGKGAAKIRWNTGGDWYRCVRYLSKYLGPRAKGYCALRHKEVTGEWTGDREHLQRYGRQRGGMNVFSNEVINSSEKVMELNALLDKTRELKQRVGLVASANEYSQNFAVGFSIPLVIPEQKESGDGRSFKKEAINFRELPLPLMWQQKTGSGHDGSIVVGRIDHMERTEDGIGNAYGVFDESQDAKEVVRLIKNGFIKGVSADMDQFEAKEVKPEASDDDSLNEKTLGKDKIVINKARIMGVTIVPKPAFQECKIFIKDNESPQEEPVLEDGIYVDDANPSDAEALVACGIIAGGIPLTPPSDWFADPKLSGPTPINVDDTGRVFGHIAAWNVDHIGMARGVKPPRSKSKYAYFHTGVVRTEDGTDVPVGQLTLAGGHASLEASASEAVRHYDDTASAVADVHAGEDQYGIWVAGSLRPDASPEQIRALRASAPSGDWRPIRGSLELVAVCQVNVPGFPIARARVASGAVMALVAAGAQTLAKMKSDPVTELADRLNHLEGLVLENKVEALASAKSKFAEFKAQRNAELSTKAAELAARVKSVEEFQYDDQFAFVSRKTREKLAQEGKALPDGSYPIRNASDLKNAIQAFGRAKNKAATKRHIIKRANALKKSDLIPEEWTSTSNIDSVIASMRSKIAELSASEDGSDPKKVSAPVAEAGANSAEFAPTDVPEQGLEPVPASPEDELMPAPTVESGSRAKGAFTPQTQPRDEAGKFRKVLARLKNNLGVAGLQKIVEDAKEIDRLHELGDYAESAGASIRLLDIVDRLDAGALNSTSIENVRSSAKELGKVISNLPLGFNNQAKKVRYSDLPPSLRDLMDSMITRVEAKIGQKDADIATAELKSFKGGADVYSQGEISSQMSKLLRLLT
jgi:hypothetical protein